MRIAHPMTEVILQSFTAYVTERNGFFLIHFIVLLSNYHHVVLSIEIHCISVITGNFCN